MKYSFEVIGVAHLSSQLHSHAYEIGEYPCYHASVPSRHPDLLAYLVIPPIAIEQLSLRDLLMVDLLFRGQGYEDPLAHLPTRPLPSLLAYKSYLHWAGLKF